MDWISVQKVNPIVWEHSRENLDKNIKVRFYEYPLKVWSDQENPKYLENALHFIYFQ